MEFRPERGRVREPEKEIIDKKIIDKIERIYDKGEIRPGELSLQISEIQPKFLEKVLNGFIERYKEKEYDIRELGLFLSFLTNKTVKKYIQAEKKKGKKCEDIEPLNVTLDTQNLPEPLAHLGWENQEKSHLTIKQQDGVYIGEEMRGGKVIVEGDCEDSVGERMSGGEIIIKGDCQGYVGTKMSGGKIIIEGYCGHDNALKMKRIHPMIIPLDKLRK